MMYNLVDHEKNFLFTVGLMCVILYMGIDYWKRGDAGLPVGEGLRMYLDNSI